MRFKANTGESNTGLIRLLLTSFTERSGFLVCSHGLLVLAPFHRIAKRLIPFGFGKWPLFEFEDVLIRPWARHEVVAGRSA
jgi:hypothetical protein